MKGFTLIEILVVVIILGILAAVAIPQFAGTTTDAKSKRLAACLRIMRGQLELYRVHHNGYPDGADSAAWVAQLTEKTDEDGDTSGSEYGPYVERFPINPFNNSATVRVDDDGSSGPGQTDADVHGWYFNADTGGFFANTTEHADW